MENKEKIRLVELEGIKRNGLSVNPEIDSNSNSDSDGVEIGENGLQIRFLQNEKYGESFDSDSVRYTENSNSKNNNNNNNINNKNVNNINNLNKKLNQISQSNANKAVLLAGAMAGLAYVLSSHPLEIASILMQIDIPKSLPLSLPLSTPLNKVITSSLSPLKSSLTHSPLFPSSPLTLSVKKLTKLSKITEIISSRTAVSSKFVADNILKKSGSQFLTTVSTAAVTACDTLQTRLIAPIFGPKMRLEYR
jgi:hypothetical protein